MKKFEFEAQLWLPRKREEIFPFFADAFNLEEITPPGLRFRVVSPAPVQMQVGTEIDYRLKIRGIPIRWRSRITAWEPPHRFVDMQVDGPYRHWVHEHLFAESPGGTLCKDLVQYALFGGAIAKHLLVEPDIREIFAYRSVRLQEMFQRMPTEESQQIELRKVVAVRTPAQILHAL